MTERTAKIASREVSPRATEGIILQRRCACGNRTNDVQCDDCARKHIQRKSTRQAGGPTIPAIVGNVLGGSGQSLDAATRQFMERRFGQDFSGVRVHTDAQAAQSAREIHAQAYTAGRNVVFASGHYAPHTDSGRRLLAHELAHVVQQRDLKSMPDSLSDPDSSLERDADRAAERVMSGAGSLKLMSAGQSVLARQPAPSPQPVQPPQTPPATCPATARIQSQRHYNHGNISRSLQERYRTYLSDIVTMEAGPGPDHHGHCMQEVLSLVSNNCPARLTNLSRPCSQGDCLPIRSGNTFLDGHVTHNAQSYLEGTGVNACTVVCEQRYHCDTVSGALAAGTFRITRNYQAGTYQPLAGGPPVHITTGTVDKAEVQSGSGGNTPSRP
ncbi:DUF4157 domain-containing protein [Dyella choica]|uniref:DUF4157 domain-containing protein n=1 Tax=Dyella choica TaxID=1927959 RepID=A0A432MBB2_9GAMM|nr:DUF4157 domain-containing protein [Dyella choica]RUL78930.1 DUF4157 domain-containing protein [Dyella choica]